MRLSGRALTSVGFPAFGLSACLAKPYLAVLWSVWTTALALGKRQGLSHPHYETFQRWRPEVCIGDWGSAAPYWPTPLFTLKDNRPKSSVSQEFSQGSLNLTNERPTVYLELKFPGFILCLLYIFMI